jgi:Cu/Ag efflux protein CusF
MFQRVLKTILLGTISLVVAMPAMSAEPAGERPKAPAAGDFKEVEVYQIGAAKERDTLYISAYGGGSTIREHNLLITVKAAGTGAVKNVVAVEPKGGRITQMIKDMKPGDFVAMTAEKRYNNTYVTSFDPYRLRPGEDRGGVYAFVDTSTKKTDAGEVTLVKLHKLGRFGTVAVPNVKGESGKMVPDPNLSQAVGKLTNGDTVEIVTEGGGAVPTLKAIEPYAVPQNAVVSKITEADVQGGKTPALEVSIKDSPTTLLVPGVMSYSGKWVPEAALWSAIKQFKAGDKVVVRFRSDDGKCWLKDIAKATETAAKP